MPAVKSTDPRKKAIVAALLKEAGCGSKVTCVKETKTHFQGSVLQYHPSSDYKQRFFNNLGIFSIPKEQVNA